MSTENVKKFYEMLSANDMLREAMDKLNEEYEGVKLSGETRMNAINHKVIPLAAAWGLEFTARELADFDLGKTGELDDDELSMAAGGSGCYCCVGGGGNNIVDGAQSCICIAGGHGTGGYDAKEISSCICTILGTGNR